MPAADMWALGCLLYTLCYCVYPFTNATQLQIVNANVRFPATVPGGQPVNPAALAIMQALLQQQVHSISPAIKFLAQRCMPSRVPVNRPAHTRPFLPRQPLLRPTILQLKAAVEHAVAGGPAATLPLLAPLPHSYATSPPAISSSSAAAPVPPPVRSPPPLPETKERLFKWALR